MSYLYSNPKIYNLILTTGGTEYSQDLSSYVSYFEISCRQNADLQLSFVSGQSNTSYITIPAGTKYFFKERISGILTVYLQSSVGNVVAEILEWK